MHIYVAVIITITVLSLGIAIERKDDHRVINILAGLVFLLPIYGRVLGWW